MPTVSVIMNIYNGADFLRSAIDSVLSQTCTDWEIIAWDDHSSDDSAAIVQSYDDPRIKYFKAPGKSETLRAARLDAIDQAQGTWLAFLDQDDVWTSEKLRLQLDAASEQTGLVYGRSVYFRGRRLIRDYDHKHEFDELPEGRIFEDLLRMSCFICMSSVMVRKHVLDAMTIPDDINVSPDYYLYLEASQKHEIVAVEQPVCLYRLHGVNMSKHVYERIQEEVIFMMSHFSGHQFDKLRERRRRIHHTLLAFEKMKSPVKLWAGLMQLFTQGSAFYLLTRPVARLKRSICRQLFKPKWEKDKAALTALLVK